MPESFYPASLEVFSGQGRVYSADVSYEVQDSSGNNDIWQIVEKWLRHEEVGQPDTLTLELFVGHEWQTKRLLRFGQRLRLTYNDDPATVVWFRIRGVDLATSSASRIAVEALGIEADLEGQQFRYLLTPSRFVGSLWPFSLRSVADTLAVLFDDDYGIAPEFTLGTIESTLSSKLITIHANASSIRQMLQAVRAALLKQHGLTFERELSGDGFTFNFFEQQGWSDAERTAESADPTLRPIEASRGKAHLRIEGEVSGNAADPTLSTDNEIVTRLSDRPDQYFTRLYPYGGIDEASLIDMGASAWQVTTIEPDTPSAGSTRITFAEDLIYLPNVYAPNPSPSHQLQGVFGGGLWDITATNEPNQVVVTGSVLTEVVATPGGQPHQFYIIDTTGAGKNSVGSYVTYVYDPASEATDPRVEGTTWLQDISPYPNLFETLVGGDGSMSTWVGLDTVAGFSELGAAVITRTAEEARVTDGTYAAECQADTGEGMVSDAFDFTPDELNPYIATSIRLSVERGGCVAYFEDAAGSKYPDPDTEEEYKAASGLTQELNLGGKGLLPTIPEGETSVELVLKIVATEDDTVFFVDAVSITQSSTAWPYTPRMGPIGLYLESAEIMKARGGVQIPEFETEFIDVSYFDSDNYARVEAGSSCSLKVMADLSADNFGLSLEARAMVVESGGPGPTAKGTPFRRARFSNARKGIERIAGSYAGPGVQEPGVRQVVWDAGRRGPRPRFLEVPQKVRAASGQREFVCGHVLIEAGATAVVVELDEGALSGSLTCFGSAECYGIHLTQTDYGGWVNGGMKPVPVTDTSFIIQVEAANETDDVVIFWTIEGPCSTVLGEVIQFESILSKDTGDISVADLDDLDNTEALFYEHPFGNTERGGFERFGDYVYFAAKNANLDVSLYRITAGGAVEEMWDSEAAWSSLGKSQMFIRPTDAKVFFCADSKTYSADLNGDNLTLENTSIMDFHSAADLNNSNQYFEVQAGYCRSRTLSGTELDSTGNISARGCWVNPADPGTVYVLTPTELRAYDAADLTSYSTVASRSDPGSDYQSGCAFDWKNDFFYWFEAGQALYRRVLSTGGGATQLSTSYNGAGYGVWYLELYAPE